MPTLYSHNGATPAPLPFAIRLSDGRLRTDPSSYTAQEIADAGYVAAPDPPGYDRATQHAPVWTGAGWTVTDKTPEEIAADLAAMRQREGQRLADVVQEWLDATVRTRHYADIAACCTYVGDPNPLWDAEAVAAKTWRSAVWAAFFSIVAEVEAGVRMIPEEAALLAELPQMEWPNVGV